MKTFLAISLMLYSLLAAAIDESVFEKTYPGMKDYQNVSLQGLNTYFYAFYSKSIVFKDDSGNYIFKVQNDAGNIILELNAKIERDQQNGEMYESVTYFLPNSNIFSYSVRKTGNDITPTNDKDLLTFNFKDLKSNYEIVLNQFDTRFQKTGIKDFMLFGFMEVNIMIQTVYMENEAQRNYIYFFKGMPNPQSSLSVRAIEESESELTFNFLHSSSGLEISPKYFFQGLQQGAQIFKEFSQVSLHVIKALGFPGIKGIN